MVIQSFPPVETADEIGLVAVGGDLEVESLLLAYRSGIFPWPVSDASTLTWFAPPERAVLLFDQFHVPRRLQRAQRSSAYRFAIDEAFEEVISACALSDNRKGQEGTWITGEMVEAYVRLHKAGYCHSVECYDGERLVGGLYGVAIGGMFAGESMFYREPNASKFSFCFLVEHLRAQGVTWLDCQQLTPLLHQFGATTLPRVQFMGLLEEAIKQEISLF